MKDVLALAWTEHRRTAGLCAGLGLELVVMATRSRGTLRYLRLTLRTIGLLTRRRPRVVLVPNPSLVLSLLTVLLRPVLGYTLIVDAHNEAVQPFIHQQRWLRRLSRWVVGQADLTIVTNGQLASAVEAQGGRPFTLPDRVPEPPLSSVRKLRGEFNAVLISTFAPDEPVETVLEAVRGANIQLYVTGDHQESQTTAVQRVPPNVCLTGFLPEAEYWALLQSADAIIDLTLMDNCLVCGAYEALAVGKPMLLSRNRASVELFGDSALYTDNEPTDIRRMLESLRSERARLQSAGAIKRDELMTSWAAHAHRLSGLLQQWRSDMGP